ncbi:hypothetical protein BJG93_08600 [Paraburkholderia sprentiae WSM5005]|uniref:Uncharacterized protein n=1 Tax=Paraburkholderia sprentiae WSM5005 TaxID=754502 RepID=A0A1I9YGJ8_9BURK|nr:hypothetical protein [Paraburkholderia sprentiae]APA85431.1 hypothetical protein BJG93_08600 [Paraburkholderia sprentiae WSM5005]
MSVVTLFAWTVPAYFKGSVVDHTWVTTYDSRAKIYPALADVLIAGEHYWYSWGGFHARGGTTVSADGFLASAGADLLYASCLCQPDVDSNLDPAARGTLFSYGRDGVCHQLSNQILWATGSGRATPATVRMARGYWLSNAIFGTYGKQHAAWASKKIQCSTASGGNAMEPGHSQSDVDDFQQHLQATLKGPDADAKIKSLMNHRRALMVRVERLQDAPPGGDAPSASTLNDAYSSFLHDAADILGPDDFERVFGERPKDEMNVVDPSVYAQSVHRPRPK